MRLNSIRSLVGLQTLILCAEPLAKSTKKKKKRRRREEGSKEKLRHQVERQRGFPGTSVVKKPPAKKMQV